MFILIDCPADDGAPVKYTADEQKTSALTSPQKAMAVLWYWEINSVTVGNMEKCT
jgi:hypothetical protein